MFRGRGIFRILIMLLLIGGLLSLGGYFGYSQGFTAGIAATDGAAVEGGARAFGPYPYPYHYGYGFGFFPLFFGFGILKLLFFFFILMFISKLFWFSRWRMAGGPGGWGKGPGWHHHGPPPWQKEEAADEQMKADTDEVK